MLRKSKVFTMVLAAAILLVGAGSIAPTSTAAEQKKTTSVAEDSQQFGWLPVTESDFNDFADKYGNLSVHDKYIVYCDKINYSTGIDEVILSQSGSAKVEKIKEYNVPSDEEMLPGSASMIVVVYEAVTPGDLQITVSQIMSWNPDASKHETGTGTYTVNDDLTIVKADSYTKGDVNDDGDFNAYDVELLQKWLLAVPDTNLANWKAADFCEDEGLDVFDLCIMRRELINCIASENATTTTTTETETTTTTTTTTVSDTATSTTTYSVENPEVVDEFTPCTATLDDDFMDYIIEVTIKKEYTSSPLKVWTIDDFEGIENINSISDATSPSDKRQKIYIILKIQSKENVLKLIGDIEGLNIPDIYTVRPVNWG